MDNLECMDQWELLCNQPHKIMYFGGVAEWKVRMNVLVLRRSPVSDLIVILVQPTTPCGLSSSMISSVVQKVRSLHFTTPLP